MRCKNQLSIFLIGIFVMEQINYKFNQFWMQIYINFVNAKNTAILQHINQRADKCKKPSGTIRFIKKIKINRLIFII